MRTAHLHESSGEIATELELPEAADEIEVAVLERLVTMRGGRDLDPEGFGKHPGGSHTFRRELQLPPSADVEHLSATLRHGVLELRAPKLRPRPRRIPIRVPCGVNGSACAD